MNKRITVANRQPGMGYIDPLSAYGNVLPSGVVAVDTKVLDWAILVAWLDGAEHVLHSWDKATTKEKKKCRKQR